MLLINLDGNTTVQIQVSTENSAGNEVLNVRQTQRTKYARMSRDSKTMHDNSTREEYHLTPKDGNLQSQTMLLNGKILEVNSSGKIPPLEPQIVNRTDPISVAPSSIVFVDFPGTKFPACM